jgi:UDP-glucose 4-epimerase
MKILITGGAGYIGSHTTNQLLNAGHQVVVYDNLFTGFREAIPAEAEFVLGDVRDSEKLAQTMTDFNIEAVVHFAAMLNVAESVVQPIQYYENNTLGVLSLVKACQKSGVKKVVFSSTSAVYGDESDGNLLSEESPLKPVNPYGWSKLMSEGVLRDCEIAYGIRSAIFRYFNVAGASADGKNGQRTKNAYHLVHIAAQAASGKRDKMAIFGQDYPTPDGTCVRDYIHVEDLADIHVLGLDYLNKGGKTDVFNCGYGHGYSVREVIQTVKKVTGVDFKVEEKGRRAGDPASLVALSKKTSNVLGWKPSFDSLDLICKSAVSWEKTWNGSL